MSSNNDIWPFSQILGIKHAEVMFPIIVRMRRYANGHPWNAGVMELYVQRQSTHGAQLIKYSQLALLSVLVSTTDLSFVLGW